MKVYTCDLGAQILSFERQPTPIFTPATFSCPISWIPGAGKNSLTWAPHIMHDTGPLGTGLFYLYYSRCLCVGVAVSSSPLGPFEDKGVLEYLAIDAFAFRDEPSGQLYLYYGKLLQPRAMLFEGTFESIYGVKMRSPTEVDRDHTPVQVLKPDQRWWEFNTSSDGGMGRAGCRTEVSRRPPPGRVRLHWYHRGRGSP